MVSSHLNGSSEEQNGMIVDYLQRKSGVNSARNEKKQMQDEMIVDNSRHGVHEITTSAMDQIGLKVHGFYYIAFIFWILERKQRGTFLILIFGYSRFLIFFIIF